MRLNNTMYPIWHECKRIEDMAGFLPKDIIYPSNITDVQKTSAKKAILWLLTKAPHNVYEIADHFAMSPELVKYLMQELISSGLLSDKKLLRYNSRIRTNIASSVR